MRNNKQFRVNGKNILLTYPKCSLEKEELLDFLKKRGELTEYVICKEMHEDGEPHLHAWVAYSDKQDIKNERMFDLLGFHPNIQKAKNRRACINYVKKSRDFIFQMKDEKLKWKGIIEESRTAEEFKENVKNNYARDWVINYDKVMSYIDLAYHCNSSDGEEILFQEFPNLPPAVKEWADRWIWNRGANCTERPKSLIICGPSRYGKTEWAKTLGKFIHMEQIFNLDNMRTDESYRFIVLDDLDWSSFPFWKAFLGCQRRFTLSDKYRQKVNIRNWGKPCIVLCNEDNNPRLNLGKSAGNWLSSNCLEIFLDERLYDPLGKFAKNLDFHEFSSPPTKNAENTPLSFSPPPQQTEGRIEDKEEHLTPKFRGKRATHSPRISKKPRMA